MDHLSIIELVNKLYVDYDGNLDRVIDWFYSKRFIAKKLALQDTLLIYYLDKTQLWTKWARQARGVIVKIVKLDQNMKRFIPIKYSLDRGAEVLTTIHKLHDITETENTSSIQFDKTQIDIMHKLANNIPFKNYLSMKVDGMLVNITLYNNKSNIAKEISEYINNSNDNFGKLVLKLCSDLDCDFIAVISTSKTFNIELDEIIGYVISAFLVSLNVITYEEIVEFAKYSYHPYPYDLMKQYGKHIIEKLKVFYNNLTSFDTFVTLSFEAVCPNLTCPWNYYHNELTINYPNAFVKFLSYATDFVVTPHFEFSELIHKMGFDEPFWWEINDVSKINNMIRDICQPDFLVKYPPNNTYLVKNNYIDYEGFVLWTPDKDKYDYEKIKTVEYYENHNPRNIWKLLDISNVTYTNIFANTKRVKQFFEEIKINFKKIYYDIRNIIIDKNYMLNKEIQELIHPYNNIYDYIVSKLNNRAKVTINNLPDEKLVKIIINNEHFYPILRLLFEEYYNELKCATKEELGSFLTQIVMQIEPWKSNSESNADSNITKMINSKHQNIEKLFKIVKKYEHSIKYAEYKLFNVFGCPLSTDIDVMVIMNNNNDLYKDIDINKIKHELQSLGYDVENRTIDINKAIISDGVIIRSLKGGIEANNIIFSTYKYHKQLYNCCIAKMVKLDFDEKLVSTAKFILDHGRVLIGDTEYEKIHNEVKNSFSSESKLKLAKYMIKLIKLNKDSKDSKDKIKSLTMKIIQLIIAKRDDDYEYTKEGMALKFAKYYPEYYDGALWLLTRGSRGVYQEECLKILINEFDKFIM